MKTFRWTVPEPDLSAVEIRQHQAYEKKKGIEWNATKGTGLDIEPKNWRERWAIYKINQTKSVWSASWIIIYASMMTFFWRTNEDMEPFIWIIWILAIFVIDETIRSVAIREIITRIKEKGSDPVGVVNDEAAPRRD